MQKNPALYIQISLKYRKNHMEAIKHAFQSGLLTKMYQKSSMIDENSKEKLFLANIDYTIVTLTC